mmetsp:Transcript_85/g.171  ORF Transcript_85/g.171 Transcript_85/m.171 type:complete len:379 (+) Transcript_85:225-1361(+)|eukprot:CAMPEP_0182559556 /NCGR_PEP_ID=MMETSP1324-20130603/2634_1 /TAXON_ID=236786 /ORGANISM="Florenciella sp., Strain RCC1587" /LENGTH=378 /DNA_ID=CAMNT_0024771827 /DNA_START=205 /DNA_END=1341 /DNA_ORIENTATION=+
MAQAVLVTQGAANSLAHYGIEDGQVPQNWNKRGSIVKAPGHYKQPDVALQKMRESRQSAKMNASSNGPSGMIGSDPSVSGTTTSSRAQTIVDRGADNVATAAEKLHNSHLPGADRVAADLAAELTEINPFAVINMPIDIQIQFRVKMFTLLCLTNSILLLMMTSIVFWSPLHKALVGLNWLILLSFFGWIYALVIMYAVKDKYPYNYLSLATFVFFAGLFLGSFSESFRSYANFQIVMYCTLSVFIFSVLSCTRFNGQLWPYARNSIIAWVITFTISLLNQCNVYGPYSMGKPGHFTMSWIITTMVLWWFSYDAKRIETRLTPDDYMMAVICFYSDFVIVFVCCCCAMICCGSGSDGGAPATTITDKDEEQEQKKRQR